MRAQAGWTVLVIAGVLATGAPVAGQDPASLPPLTRPGFAPPASERRGSSVETLERMTGEGAAEFTQEREREAEPDEIETDRDSFTPATTITGRGRLIVESAYSFLDNRAFKETHSFPEFLLRYGLSDRVELRFGWNAEIGGAAAEVSGAEGAGEGPTSGQSRLLREYTLSYGLKVRVTDQDRWVPRSAVIVQGFTPTGGSAGVSTATQLVATYVAGWQFANRWRFDAAIRYGTANEDGDHFNQWAPSAVLKVPVGEKWAAHVEYFGTYTTGKAQNTTQHFVSPGLHYLVTPNLEVGFRLGWGLNDQSARFFANAGIGWRF
jgi:hypothetical protein